MEEMICDTCNITKEIEINKYYKSEQRVKYLIEKFCNSCLSNGMTVKEKHEKELYIRAMREHMRIINEALSDISKSINMKNKNDCAIIIAKKILPELEKMKDMIDNPNGYHISSTYDEKANKYIYTISKKQ